MGARGAAVKGAWTACTVRCHSALLYGNLRNCGQHTVSNLPQHTLKTERVIFCAPLMSVARLISVLESPTAGQPYFALSSVVATPTSRVSTLFAFNGMYAVR